MAKTALVTDAEGKEVIYSTGQIINTKISIGYFDNLQAINQDIVSYVREKANENLLTMQMIADDIFKMPLIIEYIGVKKNDDDMGYGMRKNNIIYAINIGMRRWIERDWNKAC